MIDRLNAWLVLLVIVIGGASIGTSVVVAARTDSKVCAVSNTQGDRTRRFLDDLLKDPSVTADARAKVAALALKDFPHQTCK